MEHVWLVCEGFMSDMVKVHGIFSDDVKAKDFVNGKLRSTRKDWKLNTSTDQLEWWTDEGEWLSIGKEKVQ